LKILLLDIECAPNLATVWGIWQQNIAMLKSIHSLMDEADAIVHYNGNRFDIPMLNKEFLEAGMPPPSPAKHIDLLQTSRSKFRFVSNKLDYIAQRLGLGKKTAHEGHELWLKVMNNDRSAWKRMEEYNRNDVVLLEKVYDKFKGWISNHPNHNHFSEERVCPSCASHKVQQRGYAVLTGGKYPRFQCQTCGSWFRGNKKLTTDKSEKFVKI